MVALCFVMGDTKGRKGRQGMNEDPHRDEGFAKGKEYAERHHQDHWMSGIAKALQMGMYPGEKIFDEAWAAGFESIAKDNRE